MNKNTSTVVSVVVGIRNETKYGEAMLREVWGVMDAAYEDFEIIVVDDASDDGTDVLIRRLLDELPNIQYYGLSRPMGLGIAMVAGLDNSIGDFVVTFNPLEDPPQVIPEMVEVAQDGHDIVYGVADQGARPGSSFLYRMMVRGYYRLFRASTGLRLSGSATALRVLSRRMVNHVAESPSRHELLSVLPALIGYEHAEYPYSPGKRYASGSERSLFAGMASGVNMLLATSVRPLRVASVLGLLAATLNLAYSGYILAIAVFKSDVAEGWVTLSAQSSGMFFLFSLMLAMMSEFLYRISSDILGPQPYFISREESSVGLRRRGDLNLLDQEGKWAQGEE